MKKKKDTLVVIGNGFDLWQGLPTRYAQFREYYFAHRDEILKRLHIKKQNVRQADGSWAALTDVERIYGDPFRPSELADQFWGSFETSLAGVDAERLNLFFGKSPRGLRRMRRSIRNASRILTAAFSDWVSSIAIDGKSSEYSFGEHCIFLNFNYTDTLQKRFGISPRDEFHIHGEASDPASIVFGHADHPQQPVEALSRLGGRFRGLSLVEELLYETDKQVHENILMLCAFLAARGVQNGEIRNIYVLGHSMSPPDLDYFAFLWDATRVPPAEPDAPPEDPEEEGPLEEWHAQVQYAVTRYGAPGGQPDPRWERAAARQLRREQETLRAQLERELFGESPRRPPAETPPARTEDALWRLSYYGPEDRAWKEAVLRELGCARYELLPSIDACLETLAP